MAAAILNFLLVQLLPLFIIIGVLNVASFGHNLWKGIKRPHLTRKHFAMFIVSLLVISPLFVPYSFEIEGNGSIIIQFYSKPDNVTDEVIPILAARGMEIILSISPSTMPNATNITKQLNENGIKVFATLCVEKEKGIFAHDGNALEFVSLYRKFREWANENKLKFEGILIDSEPDWRFINSLTLMGRKGNWISVEKALANQVDETKHKCAVKIYQELIEEAKADGYDVILIAMPMVVDDVIDGDAFLQKIQGIASIPPHGWDGMTFMIYRSTYENIFGYDFGSYLVYSYGKTIKRMFPNGSVSIGVAGYFNEPEFFLKHSTYLDVADISNDIKILNGLGFSKVQIFSLGSFLDTFGVEGLAHIETKGKAKVVYSKWTAILRGGTLVLDRLEEILRF
jgi:hypothetical protein